MSLGQLFGKPSRVVLLHYHIFKNAGTTIDFALRQNFGDKLIYLHGDQFDSCLSDNEVLNFVSERPDVAAISSHHMRPPAPSSPDMKFLEIIILREPLDRLCSIYDFYRRNDHENDPLTVTAKKTGLREFVKALRHDHPHLLENPQLNFVANQGKRIPTREDMGRGVSLLKNIATLGTTEFLPQALTTAEYDLRKQLGKIDLSYMSQNITRDRPRVAGAERLREACGAELYCEVCTTLELDSELYRQTTEEVRRRFQHVPDREKRLSDFRIRCRRHESDAEMIIAASNHPHDFVKFLR